DEETEPIGMRHLGRLRIVLQLDEGVCHGGEAEGAQPFDGGVNEHDDLQSIVVIATANVGMEENGHVRGRSGPVLAVAQDGGDGLVGACVEEQRSRTSGIDTIGPVALDKTENADGGSKALFGMWA